MMHQVVYDPSMDPLQDIVLMILVACRVPPRDEHPSAGAPH